MIRKEVTHARTFTESGGASWTVVGALLHPSIEDFWLLTFSNAMGRTLYLRVESDAWMRLPDQWLRALRAKAGPQRRRIHARGDR